jgi:hypothetical protein
METKREMRDQTLNRCGRVAPRWVGFYGLQTRTTVYPDSQIFDT